MKINWGALGVTIAVLFLAVSILTLGLVVDRKISKLEQQIAIVKTSIKREVIAQSYAFSKAESEKRGIRLGLIDESENYSIMIRV